MHGIHEVGGERAVSRVAQAMACADPLEAIDAMAQDAPAADQIGPAQRQLRVRRPEILDARQDLVEVAQVAPLNRAEAEAGDHPTAHDEAPLAIAHGGQTSMLRLLGVAPVAGAREDARRASRGMIMADVAAILEQIRADDVRTVDFRFTDLRGQWQHVGVAAGAVDEALLEHGVMFDGSALAGWRDVSQSDMLLKPDLATAVLDPFSAQPSLILICNVAEPTTGLGYERCPRSVAERAEAHLAASGVAERILIAPQAEFCVFDDVRFAIATNEAFFRVDSEEGGYNSGTRYDVGNSGHRPRPGAPLVVPPIEYMADLRAEMTTMLATMGLDPRQQHHDTASSQSTIAIGADGLVRSADRTADLQVRRAQRRPLVRQERDLPAQAAWRSSRARACRSSRRCGAPSGRCSPARATRT